jgi:hypothetical protein
MVRERTRTVNQMHGFLLEFGISLPVGKTAVTRLAAVLAMQELPPRLVAILERLHQHFKYLEEQIGEIDQELARQLAEDEVGQRLMSIPGVGPVTEARWPRKWATQSSTDAVAILRHRLGSFPGNAVRAARPIFSGSAGAATKMSGACSSCAPGPTCEAWRNEPVAWQTGFAQCSRSGIQTWWRVRWPTSWLEPPGPLLRAKPHSTPASQATHSERAQLYHYLPIIQLVLRRLKIDDVNGTPARRKT